jgi:hypothetical protein
VRRARRAHRQLGVQCFGLRFALLERATKIFRLAQARIERHAALFEPCLAIEQLRVALVQGELPAGQLGFTLGQGTQASLQLLLHAHQLAESARHLCREAFAAARLFVATAVSCLHPPVLRGGRWNRLVRA